VPDPHEHREPGASGEVDSPAFKADCRFGPARRLHTRAEFDAVFQRGLKLVGRAFVCYYAPASGAPSADAACVERDSRLGLVVSRKVGKAVSRNRVKRHLREWFRLHRARLREPLDLVVVARPPAARLDYRATESALRHLLHEGKLLDG